MKKKKFKKKLKESIEYSTNNNIKYSKYLAENIDIIIDILINPKNKKELLKKLENQSELIKKSYE